MFPGCRAMNSYPYQSDQSPSFNYHHPSWEAAPPMPVKENPVPWPQYYGCAVPMQCPNCCNHGHYPSYNFFSPHCQHVPSPPTTFYGGYPPYPQPCHASFVLPSHYTVELPRYDYDKSVPNKFHCCGCPNHLCNKVDDKRIKIEEHKPDVETRKIESLVPARVNNLPYPFMWGPFGYMNYEKSRLVDERVDDKSQWLQKPVETKSDEHQYPPFVKPTQLQRLTEPPLVEPRALEQDPNGGHQWFPLDMDGLKKLMEDGVGMKSHDQEGKNDDGKNTEVVESKDQHKQFPYNIIWVPSGGRGDDEKRKVGTFKVVPNKSEHFDSGEGEEKTEVGDSNSSVGTQATVGNVKTIPVKQLEEYDPKMLNKSKELKEDGAKVEETKGNANEERGRNGARWQSSSPTKKSKLPPICLRVDPPKKRNGKGSSRSPSPPGEKKRDSLDDSKTCNKKEAILPSKKEMKVAVDEDVKVPLVGKIEKKEPVVVEDKAIDVEKAVPEVDGGNLGSRVGDIKEVQTQEKVGEKESNISEKKKSLTETESAVTIQSAYRGYEVRRWEPLKKLRQIAKIREEAQEVKKHVEDLVSGARNSTEKEKVAVGETIIKLLLNLDAIQGSLPIIRNVRKCVAKELTFLQEKLDSITSQNPAPSDETGAMVEEKLSGTDEGSKNDGKTADESASKDSGHVESFEDDSETANDFSKDSNQDESSYTTEKVSLLDEGSHELDMDAKEFKEEELAPTMKEVSSSQPLINQDVLCDSENKESLEASFVNKIPEDVDQHNGPPNEVAVSSAGCPTEHRVVDSGTSMETIDSENDELPKELSKESQGSPASPKSVDGGAMQTDGNVEEEENLLAELPAEALEHAEVDKESSQMDDEMDITFEEEPLKVAVSEATDADTAPEDKHMVEVGILATSEVLSCETLEKISEVEQSSENFEDINTIESESCKLDRLSSEAIEIDIPAVEQEQNDEEIHVGDLIISNQSDETKQSLNMDNLELVSSISTLESPASEDGNANNPLVGSETVKQEVSKTEEVIGKKITEENENLKEMLEKLIAYGKQQQHVICTLNDKVEDLEKRLAKKKKTKRSRVKVSGKDMLKD